MGLKEKIKSVANKVGNTVGLSGHDIGAIALAPFTAGASLGATSAAKNMLQNPMGTLEGATTGFEAMGPIGALLGGIQGGGGFGSAKSVADNAIQEQYKYQLALQQQAQNWQTGMSNTAHQREVADLKAAGLNPVLSAGGSGASTGSVGAGSVGMPDKVAEKTAEMQNKIANLTLRNELANSAKQRELIDAEITKTEKEANYTETLDKNASTKTKAMENDENLANSWWGRNISPVLRDIFGGGGAATGAVAGAAVSQAHTSAKKIKPVKRNKIGF